MPPKTNRVVRLDSMPINQTYFTEEGYLVDRPILTSTGIFEYHNYDGTVRRELRIPEEVFDTESLASYKGHPIIITHDAGLVDKSNVRKNSVGTILSKGYRTGDDVRAEIIIHDMDEVKRSGLKELSLGYNLELDETPGVWNGEPYDAIQRNIRINHLALVREARAGDQARLNIDSKDSDKNILKGGKIMAKRNRYSRRNDGALSPDELKEAIEQYKAQKQGGAPAPDAGGMPPMPNQQQAGQPDMGAGLPGVGQDDDEEPEMLNDKSRPEDVLNFVRGRRDRRDEAGDPNDEDEAMGMIAQQDEDINYLCDALDAMIAKRDFNETGDEEEDSLPEAPKSPLAKKGENGPEMIDEDGDEEMQKPENNELENLRRELDGKDEDVQVLFDIIDTLLAKNDMNSNTDGDEGIDEEDEDLGSVNEDEDDEDIDFGDDEDEDDDYEEDEDDDVDFEDEEEDEDYEEDEDDEEEDDEEEFATDADDSKIPYRGRIKGMNADSVDALVRERVRIGLVGKQLNMDGLENMNAKRAKKAIIKAVRPSVNLDGKSDAYINAAFDCACNDVDAMTHKGTAYQKKQMFNKKKSSRADSADMSSYAARERMLKRRSKNNF